MIVLTVGRYSTVKVGLLGVFLVIIKYKHLQKN